MRRLASLFVSVMLALGTFAWIGPSPAAFAQDAGRFHRLLGRELDHRFAGTDRRTRRRTLRTRTQNHSEK